MNHTFTITVSHPTASAAAIREDITDLITDAAGGYVGDPDRALYGATGIIVKESA